MSKKAKADSNFSQDFSELEEIIEWFEGEDMDLEEGLTKFERGLELAKRCQARLSEVENKVVEIKSKFDDFDGDDSEAEEGEEDEGGDEDAPVGQLF